MKEDDNNWPTPDRVGRQELEIVMGQEHISFTTTKLGSLLQVGSHVPVGKLNESDALFRPPLPTCIHDCPEGQTDCGLDFTGWPRQTLTAGLTAAGAAEPGPRGAAHLLLPRPGAVMSQTFGTSPDQWDL